MFSTIYEQYPYSSSMPPFQIFIDGGIGVGKTTLTKALVGKLGLAAAAYEPINSWVDHDFLSIKDSTAQNVNFLEQYYLDRPNFAFPFQVFATTNLFKHDTSVLRSATQNGAEVVLFERSSWSTNVFSTKAVMDDCITPIEHEILQQLLTSLTTPPLSALTHFDLIFYLHTDPQVAFNRIQHRDRAEENKMTLDHVKAITDQYDIWFAKDPSLGPNTSEYGIIPLDSSLTMDQLVQQVVLNYEIMKTKAKIFAFHK
jgi:deoxyadenosine/deoxycytidine kinase